MTISGLLHIQDGACQEKKYGKVFETMSIARIRYHECEVKAK